MVLIRRSQMSSTGTIAVVCVLIIGCANLAASDRAKSSAETLHRLSETQVRLERVTAPPVRVQPEACPTTSLREVPSDWYRLSQLPDTAYQRLYPVIADNGAGYLMHGIQYLKLNGLDTVSCQACFAGSGDDGMTWTNYGCPWYHVPVTDPSVDYTGSGTLFYGTLVPLAFPDGGTVILLAFPDPTDPGTWLVDSWGWSPSVAWETRAASIACFDSGNEWDFGCQALSVSNEFDTGNPVSGSPVYFCRYTESEARFW
jgi:hypothetical protein